MVSARAVAEIGVCIKMFASPGFSSPLKPEELGFAMAVTNYMCVLIFISTVTATSRLKKPSLSIIAELLPSPAEDIVDMEYCPPTLQEQVWRYSESHSHIPLLCLQVSYQRRADHKNEEILDLVFVQLKIMDANEGIDIVVESIKWNTMIAAGIHSPDERVTIFDSSRPDYPNYQRWKRFLLKKMNVSPSYFGNTLPQDLFTRLKRRNVDNASNISGVSHLLAAIAQNIDKGLITAQSLKVKVEETLKHTVTIDKRIKRLSSTLDSTSKSVDITELQEKGMRVERLFTSISTEITSLEKQKQDLKYDIDDFYVQLTAANVSQEHRDKGPLHRVSLNGDGYAMLQSPAYGTSFSFSLLFRTSSPDGLLFFSSNNSMEYWYSLMLVKGRLVFRYKLADEVIEFPTNTQNMNDNKSHLVDGVKTTGSLQFFVDRKWVAFSTVSASFLSSVTWGPLYVGGIPDRPFYQSQGISITSFTGCLENITFNKKLSDFRNSVGLKNIGFICTREEHKAVTKPYYFNGVDGYASYKLPNGGVGKNFSLKLEFKTTKKEGILFSASSNKLHDALALEMRFGKLLYFLDNGDGGFMIQYEDKKLNDNQWHTILAVKRGNFLGLKVDNDPAETARFAGSDQTANTSSVLYIGGLPPKSRIPDGLTTDTKFNGCMQLQELQHHHCTLVQLQECTS